MKVEKLCIGWPWSSPFCWTLALENFLQLERPSNSFFERGVGWGPARRRIDICEKALAKNASHILLMDADQVHPLDMIPRLIAHVENGCDIISALVPARAKTTDATLFGRMAWVLKDRMKWHYEPINPDDAPLQRIDFIGSGVFMFPTSALNSLKKPWFREHVNLIDYSRHAEMDTEFCFRLKDDVGLSVWVDTTIKVRHLTDMAIDDTFAARFKDWNDYTA